MFIPNYRRGAVVTDDSVKSEWLYFIKSGTCQVLKDLKGLNPKQLKQNKNKLPSKKLPTDFSMSLPRLGNGAQGIYICSSAKGELAVS